MDKDKFRLKNSTLVTIAAIAATAVAFIVAGPAIGASVLAGCLALKGGNDFYGYKKSKALANKEDK